MEPIIAIFKIGTEFYKACKEYLLIKKVDELQHDVELIKGSFFSNALDFVEKASVCENNENTRFFLESAYNNFSQCVRIYSDSIDKFMGAATIYAIKDGIADSVKFEGTNVLSRYYNNAVDGVKDKTTVADKEKADKCEKECLILEMSYIGKAMCEYYMKEFSLCVESIDNAIGVHIEPWMRMGSFSDLLLSNRMLGRIMNALSLKILLFPIQECVDYFVVIKTIGTEYGLSLEQLKHRHKIIEILRRNKDSGNEIFTDLLHSIC